MTYDFRLWLIALATCMFAMPSVHASENYPNKPIRLIVPYPPGGLADTFSRSLAKNISDKLKQPVIIENKPGANQVIGVESVLRAPADGYTLLLGSMTSMATNIGVYRQLSYDPIKDFSPVSSLFSSPLILTVRADLSAHSVEDLVALARKHPGKTTYASLGDGGSLHLASELFSQAADIKLLRVPYKGSVQALNDVLGGNITMIFDAGSTVIPQVEGKRLRALAVTGDKPIPALPGIPTMKQAGYPSVDISVWWGLVVRSGTPKPIVDTLNKAVKATLANPEFAQPFVGHGLTIESSSAEQFGNFMREEAKRWPAFMAKIGIQAQQ
ncbi:Bug family tripartite tricarboxylate transporter substrate binding protein [Comamonas testosteroni]|uniref:Bug family tripartite tricarboxylate transporter substrate binding protein n=1 Tax=Comamonas testosteroni TaxID=285 RepID=UPI0005B49EEF|nr:tripartite tricarboxylate transporter substrate binding protein [Comamonas testosteroni]